MRAPDAAILILALVISWTFLRAHRNLNNQFNLFDLLMENGRLSRLACVFMGSFVMTTWLIVRLTLEGKLTEGFFSIYGGFWIVPIVAKMFSLNQPSESSTSTTHTESHG